MRADKIKDEPKVKLEKSSQRRYLDLQDGNEDGGELFITSVVTRDMKRARVIRESSAPNSELLDLTGE